MIQFNGKKLTGIRRIGTGGVCIGLLCTLVCALRVLGDTVNLKDGTSIQGRVIDQGDKYWIKDSNGETHLIPKDSVSSWSKGADGAPAGTPVTPSGTTPSQGTSAYPSAVTPGGNSFAAVKARAEQSQTPIAAVGLWQSFIDSNPSAADLAAAKVQLAHWQDVMDGNGEKINGKWVWGEEHKALIAKVQKLLKDATEALDNNQTLYGINKLEEALKLYPNDFNVNFELGYINLLKGVEGGRNNAKIDAGIKQLEAAVAIKPSCAEALSDLSIGYSIKQKYILSIETAYKAVQLSDSKETVGNLIADLSYAPSGIQNNSKVKPIIQEVLILSNKYGIDPKSAKWSWVRPEDKVASAKKPHKGGGGEDEEEGKDQPGIFGEGTGFFVSPDGYILTNRHVAKPGDYLMVKLADGSLHLAERIVIDDEQDMAVIKIKVKEAAPFVRLAGYDHPSVGADVAVFGFPLLDRFGLKSSVKMTRGIVTAWDKDNELCDVTVDAIVNPGNSGGPMVDHHGNLLALTAMKTVSTDGMVSTYGLGYSTSRVRKFFTKQQEKLAAAKLISGSDNGSVLTNEQLATRLTPVTVCILMCNGTPPAISGDGSIKQPGKPKAADPAN